MTLVTPTTTLVTLLLLLVVTGYLAALDTVVQRVDVVRAMRLREEEVRGADALLWLTEHRGTALNVLLVTGVLVRVGLGAVTVLFGSAQLGGDVGAVGTFVLVVLVVIVAAEVAPRTLALRSLESSGRRLAPSGRLLVRGLDPISRLLVGLGRALVPRRDGVPGPYATDRDDETDEGGTDAETIDEELEPEERAMIRSILELGDTRVREVMVPRPDLVTVAEDALLADVVAVVVEHGVSRIPVHDPDDTDTIIGVVYAKDLLKRVAADGRRRWVDLVRRPTFVPETKRCDELLRELQEATVHLALVVDEYGDLVGLVTIEDILEEIVGEIVDEHDHEDPLIAVLDDGGWRIDARLGVDDLNQLLSTDLPEEGWDTVGGLVFGILGRIPAEGESVELEGVELTVERVQGRRVVEVLVRQRGAGATPSDVAG
ncbi:hemolysin family protein [Nitriliruptor alkaliphilus]|uniref:hemolysin family protein n=1 Tax=Nitriliruptor alkaliphilus TaxID=427918 RepID=UPI00069613B1|nr:hemolysin family protein [Nitriliruptor alkaliphilus]